MIDIPTEVLGGINSRLYTALCGAPPVSRVLNFVLIARSCEGATTGKLLELWLPNALIAAGVIFFLLIIGAGWMVIMGAGEEASAQDKAKAKAALTSAVIGFLLIVSVYFILELIKFVTGVNFIKPPPL